MKTRREFIESITYGGLGLALGSSLSSCGSSSEDDPAFDGDKAARNALPGSRRDEQRESPAPYGVVDIHTHMICPTPKQATAAWAQKMAEELVQTMDSNGVSKVVLLAVTERLTLEPGWNLGNVTLQNQLNSVARRAFPHRLELLTGVDYKNFLSAEWSQQAAAQVRQQVRGGALGIKGHIGQVRTLIRLNDLLGLPREHMFLDDPKLAPLFEELGQLGGLALIHVGDDPYPGYPKNTMPFSLHNQLTYAAFSRLAAAHPSTRFVLAHMGCLPPDFASLHNLLQRHPNVHVDTSARFMLARLALHPAVADLTRKFIISHQDRVLFGTDYGPALKADYPAYDLYDSWLGGKAGTPFTHPRYPQAKIYPLGLPADVLDKVCRGNFDRLCAK